MFLTLIYGAIYISRLQSRFGPSSTFLPIDTRFDRGAIYDISSTYYAVTRDQSTMFYFDTKSNQWVDCDLNTAKSSVSYVYSQIDNSVTKLVYFPGSSSNNDVIFKYQITNSCLDLFQIGVLTLGKTQAISTSVKGSKLGNDLHIEILTTNSPLSTMIVYSSSSTVKCSWLPASTNLATVKFGTVTASNKFVYLTQNTGTGLCYLKSASALSLVSGAPVTTTFTDLNSQYPLSGSSIDPLGFPMFDFASSSDLASLTFTFAYNSNAFLYDFRYMVQNISIINLAISSQNRLYVKDSLVDISTEDVKLASTAPTAYYFSANGSNSLRISMYNVSSNQHVIPIGLDAFTINKGTPNPNEFNHNFIMNNKSPQFSIDLYCNYYSINTTFTLQSQNGINPQPIYKFATNINNNVIGFMNASDPSIIIQFPNEFIFTNQVSPTNSFDAYLNQYTNLDVSPDLTMILSNFQMGGYGNINVVQPVLVVSNDCKTETINGNLDSNHPNSYSFPLDYYYYTAAASSKFTLSGSINEVSGVCSMSFNKQVTLPPTGGFLPPPTGPSTSAIIPKSTIFIDPYLNSLSISTQSITFANNQIKIPLNQNTMNSLQYYNNQQYNIQFILTPSGCTPMPSITSDATILDYSNNVIKITVDSNAFDILTSYALDIKVDNSMNNGQCQLSTSTSFTAGSNKYLVNNWLNTTTYKNGKLRLITTPYFNNIMSSSFSMSGSIGFQGCPSDTSITVSNSGAIYNGFIDLNVPSAFNNTRFEMSTSLSGSSICQFQLQPLTVIVNGKNYTDPILKYIDFNQLVVQSNQLQLNLFQNNTIYTQLTDYFTRGFTLQLKTSGLSWPITNLTNTVDFSKNANNLGFSGYIPLGSDLLQYTPCKRMILLQLELSGPKCHKMQFENITTYGNGIYTFTDQLALDRIKYENTLIVLPFQSQFINLFKFTNLSFDTQLNGSSCGTKFTTSQFIKNMTLQYTLKPQFQDTYTAYQFKMNGTADVCQIQMKSVFTAGTKTSVDPTLSQLTFDELDVQFTQNTLQLTNIDFMRKLNEFKGLNYQITSTLSVDQCPSTNAINLFSFNVPSSYYGNSGDYQLKTTVISEDCSFTSQYQFKVIQDPVVQYAYYKFNQIEIIGDHFGDLSGCHRQRSIYMKFSAFSDLDIGIVQNGTILSWNNHKIVIKSEWDVTRIQIQIGNYVSSWQSVIKPIYRIKSYMNAELKNNKQHYELLLDQNGLNATDTWQIDAKNDVLPLNLNGTLSDLIILDLDKDKTATNLVIYFTINSIIPGVIIIDIKRTPTLSGQNLTPNIYTDENGNYLFSMVIRDIMKYSLVDCPSITNQYAPYSVDFKSYYTESHFINPSYSIDGIFRVSSDAVVGSTNADHVQSLNNLQIVNIGVFTSNVTESVLFANTNITWKYDNKNNKLLQVGDFPLKVAMALTDYRNPSSSASFAVVASLTCNTGKVPNVFGVKESNATVPICADCPSGGICSADGSSLPTGLKGYYEIYANGAYWFAACNPEEACNGSAMCNAGYGKQLGDRCGVCSDKYYRDGFICLKCPETDNTVLILTIVGILVAFVLIIFIFIKIGRYFAAISIAVNYFQVISFHVDFIYFQVYYLEME
eukprot:NODE_87_length_21893_cov_0.496559.p1 type:complete len:1610 gc:universal NODE_87_length_21893_cov_0.496559:21521-16692(-)